MALRPSNNDNYNDHRKDNDKDNESDHGKPNANGNGIDNREEKSLRHVAMVAKVLDDNKPKTSLKRRIRTASNFIDFIQFHLIWHMLVKFSRVESERTVSKFRRGKRQLLCCVHLLHKASV